MPRKEIDYKQTIIYKIVCNDLTITDLYVGHTTSFTKRKNSHKSRCINNYPFLIYEIINNNGGWSNWNMIEIEKYPCNDANEARMRERYWYEILLSSLNSKCPTLNIEKEKERNKLYQKKYVEENYERLKEQKKQYREENKELIKEKKREYYQKNKDRINEKKKILKKWVVV